MSALTPYPECGLRQTTVDFTSARALGLVCRLEGERSGGFPGQLSQRRLGQNQKEETIASASRRTIRQEKQGLFVCLPLGAPVPFSAPLCRRANGSASSLGRFLRS